MKTKAGLFLVAALLIGAGDAPDAKKEMAKFAGTWSVSELTYNGQDSNKLKFNLVFKGNEGVIEGDDEVKKEYARIKFKIDAAAKPKIIDFTIAEGIQKDPVPGISLSRKPQVKGIKGGGVGGISEPDKRPPAGPEGVGIRCIPDRNGTVRSHRVLTVERVIVDSISQR